MNRRQRTEILVNGSREVASAMAQEISDRYEISLIEEPNQGLVMVKVRETAKRSLFYLGEMLVSECKVQIAGSMGFGIVKGHENERAYQLAVIDAAYRAQLQETLAWESVLRSEEVKIGDRHHKTYSQIAKTKVDFETMDMD